MTEDRSEKLGTNLDRLEISPQTKSHVIGGALSVVSKSPNLMVTGSLAQAIALAQNESGECLLTLKDLERINDVDLVATTWDLEAYREKFHQVAKGTGFKTEVEPIFHTCVYPVSPVRNLAIAEARVKLEVNGGNTYLVQYTTLEFLLLSLVDSIVSKKIPPIKYQGKVLRIQSLPKFSLERFKTLARAELEVRHEMNQETFRIWRRWVIAEHQQVRGDFAKLLAGRFNIVESLIDQTQLLNLVRAEEDLKQVDYNDVHRIPLLEMFLRELENDNDIDAGTQPS